jgi:hypothetical protein
MPRVTALPHAGSKPIHRCTAYRDISDELPSDAIGDAIGEAVAEATHAAWKSGHDPASGNFTVVVRFTDGTEDMDL